MDVTSRLTGCAGQAADAISVYTRVNMEDAHHCCKIQKSECPDTWIRLPKHKWPKSWSSMEDPVVLLERNLARSSSGRTIMGKEKFENVLSAHSWEQVPNWECSFVLREKKSILVCVCGRNKTGWKETKHWPNVESTMKSSRFGRTDIIPWPCLCWLHSTRMSNTQRYCGQLERYVWIQNLCWGHGKSYLILRSLAQTFPHGPMIWMVIAKKMGGTILRTGEQNKLNNCSKSQLHALDDHQFKDQEMGSVGELSEVCSRIVFKILYLAAHW